jgi:hypothetical protein
MTLTCLPLATASCSIDSSETSPVRIEIELPATVHKAPVTGRIYVTFAKDPENRARLQRSLGHQPVMKDRGVPFFGVDIQQLAPGKVAVIDSSTLGYPFARLADVPAGDYYVQAILNVYTRCERADGHVIWVPMDQWEGQHFGWSPGNYLSAIRKVHLDPATGYTFRLRLTEEIPPVAPPQDTEWVRYVKFESKKLTEFWGRPMHLGATVLLPRGYDDHPDVHYPAIYIQGHFSLAAPFGFRKTPERDTAAARERRRLRNWESGYEFQKTWRSNDFPRMVAITFQHPTPYFDGSYAVNSANNGPYQDAIMEELIPRLEREFRLIPQGYARVLTGGSTGGYESLALQVHRPADFGGVWAMYPDSLDFRRLFMINIYNDDNAFEVSGYGGLAPERIAVRTRFGQPLQTVRQLSQLAAVLGSKGRSCGHLEARWAAFGPVGDDGYAKPLWDLSTGKIDRSVAQHWRDNGYDLGHYLEQSWHRIGRDLVGKVHVSCGDMDDYYFNLSTLKLKEVLDRTTDPHYGGEVIIGTGLKLHGWHPMNKAELVRAMAKHITRNAPPGEDTNAWKHD